MTTQEVEAFLNRMLAARAKELPNPPPLGSAGGGAIDSLLGLELTLAVEEQYGIRLEDDQLTSRNLRSIPRLAHLIATMSSNGSGR